MEKDLRKLVAFAIPQVYMRLQVFREKYGLQVLGEGEGVRKKVVACKQKDVLVNEIVEVGWRKAEEVWSRFRYKGVSNKQKDFAWACLMDVLATRVYMKARDLARSDRCPREGCGGMESIYIMCSGGVCLQKSLGNVCGLCSRMSEEW